MLMFACLARWSSRLAFMLMLHFTIVVGTMKRNRRNIATDVSRLLSSEHPPALSCDPCIKRNDVLITAILHGTEADPFWDQTTSAMRQMANNLRIDLDINLANVDHAYMVSLLEDLVRTTTNKLPNALIVTIPNDRIKDAVQGVIDDGRVPVFGVNSGSEMDLPGRLAHIAQPNYMGGVVAANAMWDIFNSTASTTEIKATRKALFINHEPSNDALTRRRLGFEETLASLSSSNENDIFGTDGVVNSMNVEVEEVAVDPSLLENEIALQSFLDASLRGCRYDGVLLAGELLLEKVKSAYYHNECRWEQQILGTFDTNINIYSSISARTVAFAISQQQHLQGALSVLFATLYATTGKTLAIPSQQEAINGAYMSGPKLVEFRNLPPDTRQECEALGFPVCDQDPRFPYDLPTSPGAGSSKCGCVDMSSIRVGGVLPDPDLFEFWKPVWEAAKTAADDFGVRLVLDPLERPDDLETENTKTAEKVKSLCQEGVDGLFTSIKSQEIAYAVQFCLDLSVPVISLNSGFELSQSLDLIQHASQVEYVSGYGAGKRMVEAGMKAAYCVRFFLNDDLYDRCNGFRDAINDLASGETTFVTDMAPHQGWDSKQSFKSHVEEVIATEGDWEGIGILLVSDVFVDEALFLKEFHPKLLLGTFDVNNGVYEALENGSLLFGIDQQPYLQGYLPVALLALHAQTKQHLVSHLLETGPIYVESPPSSEQSVCEANLFQVCPEPFNKNQLDKVRPFGLTLSFVVMVLAVGFTVWTARNWKSRVVMASQPIFLTTICFGAMVMAATIIPLSLDDGVLHEDGGCLGCECQRCNVACMVAPWLFTLGFIIIFASLFSKIWRINKLMSHSHRYRRLRLSVWDVMIPFAAMLALNVIFMLVWTLVDPMYWDRTRRCGSDDLTSYGSCVVGRTNVSKSMAASVLVINLLAVVLANCQAYKARNISTEFSESRYIAFAMASIFQVIVIMVPLMIIVKDNPPAIFFVQAGGIFVIAITVLLLIFAPKIQLLKRFKKEGADMRNAGPGSNKAASVRYGQRPGSYGLRFRGSTTVQDPESTSFTRTGPLLVENHAVPQDPNEQMMKAIATVREENRNISGVESQDEDDGSQDSIGETGMKISLSG